MAPFGQGVATPMHRNQTKIFINLRDTPQTSMKKD